MPPHSPVVAGESKKYRTRQKDRIERNNKKRESTVKDKAHHAALKRVCVQIMIIQAEELSRIHHAAL